jgi:hypothetical protein
MTTNVEAIRRLFQVEASNDRTGNLPSMPGIYPDYSAPVVRNSAAGRELAMARWGMPSSQKALMDATKKRAEKQQAKGKMVDFTELLRMEPDSGDHQHPQCEEQALDEMARSREPLRGAVQQLQRIQQDRGRRDLVRARRDPPTRLLRRHLDQLDVGP